MRRYMLVQVSKPDRYSRDWKAVEEIIHTPPPTWTRYKGTNNEFESLISMEVKELMECYSESNYSCYVENLLHVAAACVYAHHAMTCKEKD